jgi:hypothetical protein
MERKTEENNKKLVLEAFDTLVGGLGVNGTMVVVGASIDSIEVSPNQLLFGKKGIKGWAGGIPTDSHGNSVVGEKV